MRFQVPQFINVEDKIFGPFTVKQFLYLAGGGGLSFILFRTLPILPAILIIIPVAGFSLALAFFRVNNRPFIYIVQAFLTYSVKSKLYLWNKDVKPKKVSEKTPEVILEAPKLSESKLRNLAWSLDVLDIEQE